MDFSYMDREVGDFTVEDKKKQKGFFVTLEFRFQDTVVSVKIIDANIRSNDDGNFNECSKTLLSCRIPKKYKQLGYAYLRYKAKSKLKLYYLPENLILKKEPLLTDEIVNVENEYKEFVFVVKYDRTKKIIKSGLIRRNGVDFIKKIYIN